MKKTIEYYDELAKLAEEQPPPPPTNRQLLDANQDKLIQWYREGKSYFWMAKEIGLGERNAAAVSKWFISHGIHRKAASFEVVASAVKFLSGKEEHAAPDDVPF